jgi:hypothetical protein
MGNPFLPRENCGSTSQLKSAFKKYYVNMLGINGLAKKKFEWIVIRNATNLALVGCPRARNFCFLKKTTTDILFI